MYYLPSWWYSLLVYRRILACFPRSFFFYFTFILLLRFGINGHINVFMVFRFNERHYCLSLFFTFVKVFRFQRKTFVFSLGFFFPIITFFLHKSFRNPISLKKFNGFVQNFYGWLWMFKSIHTYLFLDNITSVRQQFSKRSLSSRY